MRDSVVFGGSEGTRCVNMGSSSEEGRREGRREGGGGGRRE